MPKPDWKSAGVKNALRNIALVGLSCILIYLAILFAGLLPIATGVDQTVYLANLARMATEIFTTAIGVVLGLSLFLLLLRFFLEQDEDQIREEA